MKFKVKMQKRIDRIKSFSKLLLLILCIAAYFVFSEFVLKFTIFKEVKDDFDYYQNLVFSKEESEKAAKFKRDLTSIGKERGISIPGTIIYKYKPAVTESFTINSDGFRNEEFRKKEKDEFRIALYGDSKIFGFALQTEDTIPYVIEKKLRKHFNRNITVLNMGVEGHELQREIATARYYNEKIEPDMVVFYSWINDILGTFTHSNIDWMPFQGDETLTPIPEETVYDKVKLLNTLRQTYISDRARITARIQKSDFAVLPIPPQKVDFAEKFPETFLNRISDAAAYFDKLGIKSLFILMPLIQTKKPLSNIEIQTIYMNEAASPGINLFYSKCIEGVKKALKTGKYDTNVIDNSEVFQGIPDTVFYDGIHYTPTALKIEADKMSEDIIKILETGRYFENK